MTTLLQFAPAKRVRLLPAICCVLVVVLAAGLTWRQLNDTQMLKEGRVSLKRYLDGTADRPFCYRVLVPTLMRVASPILRAIPRANPTGVHVDSIETSDSSSPTDGACVALVVILVMSLLVYAAVSGQAYREFFSSSPLAAGIGSIGALLFLAPFVTRGVGHVYDFSVLMFHSAMLLCIAQKRLKLYLVLFALSCANKETTILMSFAFAACLYDAIPRGKLVTYLFLQLGLFVLIYAIVTRSFPDNGGAGMEFWLSRQLPLLISRWKSGIAIPVAIAALVAYGWSQKPVVFRRATFMLVPHLALYVCGASPGEIRNLYESVPVLALLSIKTVEIVSAQCVPDAAWNKAWI